MRSALLTVLAFLVPSALACQAPDFSGSYAMSGDNGQIVVTLQPTAPGAYSGTMSNGGLTWQLEGEIYEDALTGTVNTGQGMLAFEAYVDDNGLEFILVQVGPDGTPDVENGQQFLFARMGGPQGGDNVVEQRTPVPGYPPGGPAADPFVGTFSNGEMTLQLQGGNGNYTGQLAVGNEAFPVAIGRNGDRLEGVMNAANGQYAFYLDQTGDGVAIDNAGEVYSLPRVQGVQSASPPGAPAQMPGAPAQGGAQQGAGPSGAGQVDQSPLAQQWRQVLAGKKVTYISSYNSNTLGGGGTSTRNVYHICSDGRFAFSDNSSVTLNTPGSPDLGTPGTADGGSGTWRIVTEGQLAGVELRFNSGEVVVYRLDMQGNEVYANGDRVYVTPGELCY